MAIEFKLPPLNLFTTVECEGDICDLVGARPNTLLFRIQPSESISLSFSTKRPGMQYQIHPVEMDFAYESAFHGVLPEAYERLLLDVLRGDSTLSPAATNSRRPGGSSRLSSITGKTQRSTRTVRPQDTWGSGGRGSADQSLRVSLAGPGAVERRKRSIQSGTCVSRETRVASVRR